MWEDLARAFCLVLVIEGMIPFLYPRRWRQLVATLALLDERRLRLAGLTSMLIGAALLWLLR